jgi:hypothetical protein
MAEDNQYQAPIATPSTYETVAASVKRSVPGTLLYQPSLMESLLPSNQTLVSDGEIETRLGQENMLHHMDKFTDINTQGELDAKISKLVYARDNDAILKASGTGSWLLGETAAAIMDPTNLIPIAGQAAKVGKVGATVADRALGFAVTGAAQAAAHEGLMYAGDPTHETSPGSLLASVGAGAVMGAVFGRVIGGREIGKDTAALAEGVKRELIAAVDGKLDTAADTLAGKIVTTMQDVTRNPVKYEKITSDLATYLGEQPTSSQIAYASSFGMETVNKRTMRLFGSSNKMEMMASEFPAAREFAANLFMTRGNLTNAGEAMTGPISAYALQGEVDGMRNIARGSHLETWKDWAAENAKVYGGLERNLPSGVNSGTITNTIRRTLNAQEHDVSLSQFSDLVYRAVVYGEKAADHVTGKDLEAVMNPHVQKAAAAYRKFDDGIWEKVVSSGLAPRDQRVQEHITRRYSDRILGNEEQFIKRESEAHFDHTWAEVKATAEKEHSATIETLTKEHAAARDKLEAARDMRPTDVVQSAEKKAQDALKVKLDQSVKDLEARLFGRQTSTGKFQRGELHRQQDAVNKDIEAQYNDALKNLTRPDTKEFRTARAQEIAQIRGELTSKRAEAEANAHTQFAGNEAALEEKLQNVGKYYDDRLKNVEAAASKLSRSVSRTKYADRQEVLRNYYNELHVEKMRGIEDSLSSKFDTMSAKIYEAQDPATKRGKRATERLQADAAKAGDTVAEGLGKELNALDAEFYKASQDATDAYRKATGMEAMFDQKRQSAAHADGVFKAIAYGETGQGARGSGIPTAGNIQFGRKARNVFTPTHEMLANGWLDTDVLGLINKQARQDGHAAILAAKFRRPMTEEETAAARNGSKEAYWRDGHDPDTVPDLAMSGPREAILADARKAGALDDATLAALSADPKNFKLQQGVTNEAARIATHTKEMLTALDEAVGTFAGTHMDTVGSAGLTTAVGFVKSLNFTTKLGMSLITNFQDGFRAAAYHGYGEYLGYLHTRFQEKLLDDLNFGRAASTKELREYAMWANAGGEQFSHSRMTGMMDTFDPYLKSQAGNKVDAFSNMISTTGGTLFGLTLWNNYIKSQAYGVAQYRLSKLSLTDAAMHSEKDVKWLQELGMKKADLTAIATQLQAQGVTKIEGAEAGRLHLDKWTDTQARTRFLAAMNKDVTTNVVTPGGGDRLSGWGSSPIGQMALQFQGFALASADSIGMRTAQQMANGQKALGAQAIGSLFAGAYFQSWLKSYAKGEHEQFNQDWEKRPGQMFYQMFDNTGLLSALTTANNFVENVSGIGAKRAVAVLSGDRGLPGSTSLKSEAAASGPAGVLGATGAMLSSAAKVTMALQGQATGSDRYKWDDNARRELDKLIPFSNSLPGQGLSRGRDATMNSRGIDALYSNQGARKIFESAGFPGAELIAKKKH